MVTKARNVKILIINEWLILFYEVRVSTTNHLSQTFTPSPNLLSINTISSIIIIMSSIFSLEIHNDNCRKYCY